MRSIVAAENAFLRRFLAGANSGAGDSWRADGRPTGRPTRDGGRPTFRRPNLRPLTLTPPSVSNARIASSRASRRFNNSCTILETFISCLSLWRMLSAQRSKRTQGSQGSVASLGGRPKRCAILTPLSPSLPTIRPMRLCQIRQPFDSNEWVFKTKYDGDGRPVLNQRLYRRGHWCPIPFLLKTRGLHWAAYGLAAGGPVWPDVAAGDGFDAGGEIGLAAN